MTQPLDATPDSFPERLFLANLRTATNDRRALRALLKAQGLLGLAFGQELMRLRASSDPLVTAFAQAEAADVLVHCLREALDLIGERFDKIPSRQRPHYSPNQRFRILQLKHLLGLTQEQTARLFRLSEATIADWEVSANPESQTVGSTVTPVPPVRRYNDTVHHLTQTLARLGFGGYKALVQHLARAGWIIGKTTVRRYLKQKPVPDPVSEGPETPKRAVKARHPHHTWHLDLTQIHAFLRTATFHLATILDSFSRMPLVWQMFDKAPTASQMATFLDRSVSACGKPKYLIVDKGGEFTGDAFREMADAYRVKLRYCSAENHRANSRLERFWRSLKRLLRLVPATHLARPDLERDVHRALVYYAYYRPHQGLGGATPAEVYHNLTPAHCHAVRPPRGRRGDPPVPPPVTADFLEGDRRFPFLRKAA
jgi:transposase InsO family protein/DNA-binding transcriptional regulator YiaG